jgi:hypothetical protein
MTKRDFKRAVFEARAELAKVAMPDAAAARVWRRIREPAPRVALGRIGLLLAAAAGAGALAAAAVHLRRAPVVAELPEGFEAVRLSADLKWQAAPEVARDVVAVRAGTATLRVRAWGRVTLGAGTRLRRVPDGVELLGGAADFEVDKRPAAAGSTNVRVAEGSIEITGTRFSVVEGPGGGAARLAEGAIRFHAPDGRTVTLAPGQSVTWPLPPEDEPAPPPSLSPSPPPSLSPSPLPSTAPAAPLAARGPARPRDEALEADAVVDRIAALRAQGRYGALADELGAVLARTRRPLTRERLSFELGAVLSFHLPDGARACAHWDDHQRAYPAGHYAEEVAEARRILGCERKGDGR